MLLQHAVEVAAAEAEGADPGAPGMPGWRQPRTLVGVHVERRGPRRHLRHRLFYLERRRQHLVMQRHGDLDQRCRTRCGLGVADLRLHRTQGAPRALASALAVDGAERVGLDRVADDRAGAVCLDELHGVGADIGALVCSAQRLRLPGRAWRVDGVALAVTRCSQTSDLGVDAVAVAHRVVQALEDEDADAFTQDRSIALVVERPRIAGGAERGGLREAHVHEDVVERIDPSSDRHVTASVGQLHRGEVQRTQRARAGRVHHAVGAAQVEPVRDAACNDVPEQAREGGLLPFDVGVRDATNHVFSGFTLDARVGERLTPERMPKAGAQRNGELQRARHAHEHTDPVPVEVSIGAVAGVDQRPLRREERQKLSGIRCLQRVRRDAEVQRIEVHRGQEAAPSGIGHVRRLGVGAEVVFRGPMRVWHVRNRVDAVTDVVPVRVQAVRFGEDAGDADDGQRDVDRARFAAGLCASLFGLTLHGRCSSNCDKVRGSTCCSSGLRTTP